MLSSAVRWSSSITGRQHSHRRSRASNFAQIPLCERGWVARSRAR